MNPARAAAALEALLAEDERAAARRADEAFDAAAGGRPVVLVGAGHLGRRVAGALAAARRAPVAFADRAPGLRGATVDGIPVLSIEEVCARHAGAAFVVTIWGARSDHRIAATEAELRSRGATCIAPFTHLLWKHRVMLPHYLVDRPEGVVAQRDAVRQALALLADDASRAEYVAQVQARLTGRLDGLGEPAGHEAYIPADLIAWRDDERIVDGGAYDGDSLMAWMRERGASFGAWLAVEPHPGNASVLRRRIATLSPPIRDLVTVREVALGASAGTARFPREASAGSAALDAREHDAGTPVTVLPLDEIGEADGATYVKLDLEGAELDALSGMRHLLVRSRPALAVCAYHRQDHLWRVPLTIAALRNGDQMHLRPHGAEGWDLVCYAVPQARRPS